MYRAHPHWFAGMLAELALERGRTCAAAASVIGVSLFLVEDDGPPWDRVGDEIRVYVTSEEQAAQAHALGAFIVSTASFATEPGWARAFAEKLLEFLARGADSEKAMRVQFQAAFKHGLPLGR